MDGQLARAEAVDASAALYQHLAEHGDVGLERGVLQHRRSFGERGGHHELRGGADRNGFVNDRRAAQFDVLAGDVAVIDVERGAHRGKTFEMKIDRPRPPGASARQRDAGVSEAREQGSQHVDAGAHGAHQLIGRLE